MAQIKTAKAAWECKFHQDCSRCAMSSQCVSASTLSRDTRYHFLYVKGVRFPPSPEMEKGTKNHEEHLKKYPTIEEYTLERFQKDLREGKKIELQELRLCNSIYALRGIIDYLCIQMIDNKIVIKIIDLKSSWHKSYMYQVASYAMMMRHPATRIAIEGKIPRGKTRPKIESYVMLPRPNEVCHDISFGIQVFGATKSYEWDYMKDNMITDLGKVMKINIEKKLKKFRAYNKYGLYYLNEIPICKECFKKCGYYPECAKAWPKEGKVEKQLYFGARPDQKLLIKTKPSVAKKPK